MDREPQMISAAKRGRPSLIAKAGCRLDPALQQS